MSINSRFEKSNRQTNRLIEYSWKDKCNGQIDKTNVKTETQLESPTQQKN